MEQLVSVSGQISASINFAMQQNYVPVIRNLVVNNESENALENLELKISFDPAFAKEYTYSIGSIAPQESVEISPVKIQLNTQLLFSLTEKMVGTITVDLLWRDEKIFTYEDKIELLAWDEWSGLLIMPEIITAFITPNHPSVSRITHDASVLLRSWTKSASFTGYQTRNPNNVKLQMAAIYTAIQKQGIGYNSPPASYEMIGQRVRLPHIVLEQKQGTCLDFSLLYATCLEAVGLFPLLFFIKGHAFCGCWLEESTFADCVVDDVSAIQKRTTAGAEEILMVECTDLTAGKQIDFDHALKHGKDHLNHLNDFVCVVDVQRSRGSGIRPLPLRLEQTIAAADSCPQQEAISTCAPTALDSSLLGKIAKDDNHPITKVKIWERKLLDFSLRNTLLNFRVTKNALQLMTADLAQLEDQLSDGRDFRIMEVPSEWTISVRDAKMFAIENNRDLINNIAATEFKSNRIRTFLDEKDLEATLKNLYRSAKTSMEENGSSTLFLAIGFLRWFESDLSEQARYAPVVLIPVDIVRNARNKGYVIRSRQEDAQINITLLEYLRQDYGVHIGGLDPLPQDEHGIDLPLIFNTIRQAVMGKKRWNIEEMAFVGLFSFGQFVMWNDLHSRAEELKQNKVVSSLMEGALTWALESNGITVDNLDAEALLQDMAIPVSADSSQLVAIAAAAKGQSFVLHGPPGTGKSQTITNMIANALYHGKTVLFVAEKMAALNVVQRRLAAIGLDPFSLELHSNKTNKSSVLAELDKSLEVGRIKSPEEYDATAKRVYDLRVRLNDIICALHDKRSFGASLYEAITLYERNASERGKITFDRAALAALTKEKAAHWEDLIRQYGVAVSALGDYTKHAFKGVKLSVYSLELRENFSAKGEALLREIDGREADLLSLFSWLGCTQSHEKATVAALLRVAAAYEKSGSLLASLLTSADYDSKAADMRRIAQTGKEYNQLHHILTEQFDTAVFNYTFEQARLRWKQAESSWFLPKLLGQSKLIKELRLYAKETAAITKSSICEFYEQFDALASKKQEIQEVPAETAGLLSGLFMGLQSNWDAVNVALEKTDAVRQACRGISGVRLEESLRAVCNIDDAKSIHAEKERLEQFISDLTAYQQEFEIDLSAEEADAQWLSRVKQRISGYLAHLDQLRDVIAFNQCENKLRQSGLVNVCDAYRAGAITQNNLSCAYVCNLYYALTLLTLNSDERLKDFHAKTYDDLILQYQNAIDTYQKLTVQELVARLSAKIPAAGTASAATSEMGILKRAIKSNGRMLSLRRLFDQIPNLLRRLCPCMLMSPISVAQYIDPAFPKFDLVIFDEASQLPTSEAVGTIARGENVIIVGDPKQLPPTNFFSSNRIDEENGDKEDLESLLDDCLAISMPQEYLKWHYRSRHESLIAYSNMKYYDNKLYTFPSPNDLVSEVKMVHLKGFYDKGKTKQNAAEAHAIVEEILRRLRDEALREESIGVVTFSSVQQNLIDDMLCEAFAKHPDLEELDSKSHEPIFIKNLENVQGDERDVILFSVGYGPDQDGNVSMNFGPLNRDGGWRRLNVAISRARKSMIVYSVLRPEQIDLSRTRAEGVAGLKGFLEFAERGKTAVAQRVDIVRKADDAFVAAVGDAISAMGYQVKCNIGCSAFKMDLGIVDPENEESYLLGILLDGENSRQAATARDRFVLQPSVLQGLGWSVMRIWTLDWLDDPARVLQSIKNTLEAIPQRSEAKASAARPQTFAGFAFEKEESPASEGSSGKPYCSAQPALQGSADDYYLPQCKRKIQAVAAQILSVEAPISRKLLMKKVLNAWTISRGGSRVESIFLDAIKDLPMRTTLEEDRVFLWNVQQAPEKYTGFRVEDENGIKRSMEDIAFEEIQNAMIAVLQEQISLSDADLIRETAKKFGFSRMGGIIENTLHYSISRALMLGAIARAGNGNVMLAG